MSEFEDQLAQASTEEATSAVDILDDEIEAVEEIDPELAAFREKLSSMPGEWFVVHSYAGYEKKVKTNLQNRINTLHMED